MNIELYPHNQETYNKMITMWKNVNRIAAIQATGTGKSFLMLRLIFDYSEQNKVVLAPSTYILDQLLSKGDNNLPNTQLLTYSKLSNMTEEEIQKLKPSFIILDEFHRCGAEQWGKGVQKLLEVYPDAKVLGTSATPIRFLDNERDMSDEIFEGNVVVNLSLADAIVKGILPMPKYISALYTFEDETKNLIHKVVNSKNTEEEKEELLKKIDVMKNKLDKSKGIPKILKKYLIKTNGKFIVFCKNIEHLNEMKDVVEKWFKNAKLSNKIQSYVVYTGYENTDIEFEAFKNNNDSNSIKLLFSIEMLNEGLHVEDITGVILLRPTISPIIYYQQIGRAIDASSKEQPLIFDFVNNFDNIGAKQFVKDLKEARNKRVGEKRKSEEDGKENDDILEFILYDEILEIKDLFDNIESKLIDNWDKMFLKLKKYFEKYDHSDVPVKYHDDLSLGRWVQNQRNLYKKGLLINEKINKLETLNFKWDIIDDIWYHMYEQLRDFYKEYGHMNIPISNKSLRNWVNWQRQKSDLLTKEKCELLNKINFILNPNDRNWNDMFDLLSEYLNQYKIVKQDDIYQGRKIGLWVRTQRNFYKKGKLSKERIDKLNSIGFIFNPSKDIENNLSDYHIKNLLQVNEMSSVDLSKLLGITKSSIGMWCINYRNIPSKHIPKLAEIFNVEPNLIQPQKGDGCVE